jgi:aminomethyltransferase
VLKAGKKYKIAPTGPSDIRRIEAGILNYGIDMTLENNPYELGLERLVNLDKAAGLHRPGCARKVFTAGNPAQARGHRDFRQTDGPEHGALPGQRRRLRHLVRVLAAAEEEHRLRHAAGRTGRREKAPHRGPGGVRNASVVPMPFIDPKKAIAKS